MTQKTSAEIVSILARIAEQRPELWFGQLGSKRCLFGQSRYSGSKAATRVFRPSAQFPNPEMKGTNCLKPSEA